MSHAVVMQDLTKTYGRRIRAVDGLTLTVGTGEVFGFLGPNGAGKTTALRMLLGLVRPTAGSVQVFGADPGSAGVRAKVAALIEGPAFYPYLSGRDNLRALARYGDLPVANVTEALTLVSLADRAGDRYATYSLGMKQRLGVAAALLKDPDLVVLDEPTNGLDPAGMRDMRDLVRRLGAEGRTVLLSSHLMAEVQQVCDRVAVIDRGRLLTDSTVDELRGHGELVVIASPIGEARRVLGARSDVLGVRVQGDELHFQVDVRRTPEITRDLVEAGVAVSEIRRQERSLEDVFMELTDSAAVVPTETARSREGAPHV